MSCLDISDHDSGLQVVQPVRFPRLLGLCSRQPKCCVLSWGCRILIGSAGWFARACCSQATALHTVGGRKVKEVQAGSCSLLFVWMIGSIAGRSHRPKSLESDESSGLSCERSDVGWWIFPNLPYILNGTTGLIVHHSKGDEPLSVKERVQDGATVMLGWGLCLLCASWAK